MELKKYARSLNPENEVLYFYGHKVPSKCLSDWYLMSLKEAEKHGLKFADEKDIEKYGLKLAIEKAIAERRK